MKAILKNKYVQVTMGGKEYNRFKWLMTWIGISINQDKEVEERFGRQYIPYITK